MQLPLFQLDAFASELFAGNPAAVVPLEHWLRPASVMQAVALENNLSETAFFVPAWEHFPDRPHYRLRWFTPAVEVDLCGHATLASAWLVLNRLCPDAKDVRFDTRSGQLMVRRDPDSDRLVMDFPTLPPVPCPVPDGLADALGAEPVETLRSTDLVVVLRDEATVASLRPDLGALAEYDVRGVAVTAAGAGSPGPDPDFVARFFAPQSGVPEDPVTGSLYTELVPYWAPRLGRSNLRARQLSARGGELWCELQGERVTIAGRVVPYLEGTITLPD